MTDTDQAGRRGGAAGRRGHAAALLLLADSSRWCCASWRSSAACCRRRRWPGCQEPGSSSWRSRTKSWEEAKRVVWPTRKETCRRPASVFVFVVVMALFLWLVDKGLEWVALRPGAGLEANDMTQALVCGACLFGHGEERQRALQERINRAGMQDKFGKILVPTEEVVEMKSGQSTCQRAQVLPRLRAGRDGDERRHLAPGEEHQQGDRFRRRHGNKPAPISQKEVDKIMHQMQRGRGEAASPRCCSKSARWCGSRKARSPTSTATSRT